MDIQRQGKQEAKEKLRKIRQRLVSTPKKQNLERSPHVISPTTDDRRSNAENEERFHKTLSYVANFVVPIGILSSPGPSHSSKKDHRFKKQIMRAARLKFQILENLKVRRATAADSIHSRESEFSYLDNIDASIIEKSPSPYKGNGKPSEHTFEAFTPNQRTSLKENDEEFLRLKIKVEQLERVNRELQSDIDASSNKEKQDDDVSQSVIESLHEQLSRQSVQLKLANEKRDEIKSKLQRMILARSAFEEEKSNLTKAVQRLQEELVQKNDALKEVFVDFQQKKERADAELRLLKQNIEQSKEKDPSLKVQDGNEGSLKASQKSADDVIVHELKISKEQIMSLERRLESSVKANESLKKSLLSASQNAQLLKDNLKAVEGENTELQDRLLKNQQEVIDRHIFEETQSKIASMERRILIVGNRWQELENEFQSIEQRNTKLEVLLNEHEKLHQDLVAENKTLRQSSERWQQMLHSSNHQQLEELSKSKAEIDLLKIQLKEKAHLSEEAQRSILVLQQEKETLLEDHHKQMKSLNLQFEERFAEGKQLLQKISQKNENFQCLLDSKDKKIQQLQEIVETKEKSEQEFEATSQSLRDLELKVNGLKTAILSSKEREESLLQEKAEVNSVLTQCQKELSECKTNLLKSTKDSEDNKAKLQQEAEIMQKRLEESSTHTRQLEVELLESKDKASDLEEKFDLSTKLTDELKSRLNNLESEKQKIQAEKVEQVKLLAEKNEDLEAEKEVFKRELEGMKSLKSRVDNCLASLKAELQSAEDDKSTVQDQLKQGQKLVQELRKQNSTLEQQIEELKSELSEAQSNNSLSSDQLAVFEKENKSLVEMQSAAKQEIMRLSALISPALLARDKSIEQLQLRDTQTETLSTKLAETSAERAAVKKQLIEVTRDNSVPKHQGDQVDKEVRSQLQPRVFLAKCLSILLMRLEARSAVLKAFYKLKIGSLKSPKHSKGCPDCKRTNNKKKADVAQQLELVSKQSGLILEASRHLRESLEKAKKKMKLTSICFLRRFWHRHCDKLLCAISFNILRIHQQAVAREASGSCVRNTASYSPLDKVHLMSIGSLISPSTPRVRLDFTSTPQRYESSHQLARIEHMVQQSPQTYINSTRDNPLVKGFSSCSNESEKDPPSSHFNEDIVRHVDDHLRDKDSCTDQQYYGGLSNNIYPDKSSLDPDTKVEKAVSKILFRSSDDGSDPKENTEISIISWTEEHACSVSPRCLEDQEVSYISSLSNTNNQTISFKETSSTSFWNVSADETDEVNYK